MIKKLIIYEETKIERYWCLQNFLKLFNYSTFSFFMNQLIKFLFKFEWLNFVHTFEEMGNYWVPQNWRNLFDEKTPIKKRKKMIIYLHPNKLISAEKFQN